MIVGASHNGAGLGEATFRGVALGEGVLVCEVFSLAVGPDVGATELFDELFVDCAAGADSFVAFPVAGREERISG